MDITGALALESRSLVAFVGAGGKKTAMARLVEQGRERGLSVGYTTTTHTPPPSGLSLVVTGETPLQAALADAGDAVAFARERVADPERAPEKLRGYDPETVSRLFETERFDWLLVKADGARRREFKAPGSDEPVIPAEATHVVPVASVQAVGGPLDSERVHRPERVAALTETALGETVTPETVGTVLASPEGGLRRVPAGAEVVPMVNKADTPSQRETARAVLAVAFERSERLQNGLVSSFETGRCAVLDRQSVSRL